MQVEEVDVNAANGPGLPTNAGDPSGEPRSWKTLLRQFLALVGLGLIGVLSLVPLIADQVQQLPEVEALAGIPRPALVALSLIQPSLLLAMAVAVGLWLAPRLGIRSRVAEAVQPGSPGVTGFRQELSPALVGGAATGILMVVLDALFAPYLGDAAQMTIGSQPLSPRTTLMGMLYGGITEELMMRWGLMTFLAWLAWRLVQRDSARPRAPVVWTSIVLVAVIFGIGHLGAVAAQAPLTGILIFRTVVLNALGGLVFGWLCWRYSLEAAMVSHATVHVVFALVTATGLLHP